MRDYVVFRPAVVYVNTKATTSVSAWSGLLAGDQWVKPGFRYDLNTAVPNISTTLDE